MAKKSEETLQTKGLRGLVKSNAFHKEAEKAKPAKKAAAEPGAAKKPAKAGKKAAAGEAAVKKPAAEAKAGEKKAAEKKNAAESPTKHIEIKVKKTKRAVQPVEHAKPAEQKEHAVHAEHKGHAVHHEHYGEARRPHVERAERIERAAHLGHPEHPKQAEHAAHAGHAKEKHVGKGKGAPAWVELKPQEIVEAIVNLANTGHSGSEIGMLLRDQYGVPKVRLVTGKSIDDILKEHNLLPAVPEDLMNLIRKSVALRRHLAKNKKDMSAKRGLQLTVSKIRSLVRYYKKGGRLPPEWQYTEQTAALLVK